MSIEEFAQLVGVSKYTVFSMAWEHTHHTHDYKRIDYEYKRYCREHETPAFVDAYIASTYRRFKARQFPQMPLFDQA